MIPLDLTIIQWLPLACHDLVIVLFHAQKLFCTDEWLHGFAERCPVVR